jgi:radical SAM protein with 4Fe4S-binding SPASM domain
MGIYDDIRILQHKEELEKVEAGQVEDCIPIHVRLEPTEVCNFRCSFCWWHNQKNRNAFPNFKFSGKRHLGKERILNLIDELADLGTKALSFTGAGEPLLHPHLADVLHKALGRKLVFGITSNMAVPLKAELVDALAQASWIRWSLNSGTLETFLKVANPKERDPGQAFSRMQENIRRIDRSRRRLDKHSDFNASFVISNNNEDDIFAAAQIVKNLGLDSIAFRPDTPVERQEQPNIYSKTAMQHMARAQAELGSDSFQVYINEVRQEDAQKIDDPQLLCFFSNHTTYIDARGDVYPCCYTRYDSRYVIGNIMEQSFRDFWFDPKRRAFYKNLYQNACPSCGYGRFNQVLKPLYVGAAKVSDILVKVDHRNYFI